MDFGADPELMEMFRAELADRSRRLIESARLLTPEAPVDQNLAFEARRHAHTIKGNSRFLNFPVLSEAAAVLEQIWRQAADTGGGEIVALRDRLIRTAELLVPAGERGDTAAEAELIEAVTDLAEAAGTANPLLDGAL